MTVLILTGVLGGWLVHQANQAYDGMRTCRYRDFKRLSRKAEAFVAGYRVLGVVSLALPGGPVVSTAIFGYALIRRLRAN
jgi:hypothetical protein